MKKLYILAIILLFSISFLNANELINSDYDDYFKYLELTGRAKSPVLSYHSYSANNWIYNDSVNPWSKRMELDQTIYKNDWMSLKLLDPELFLSFNSTHQWGLNDGAMWQGKGLNGMVQAGISWKSKFVSITFYPKIWFAQNLFYDILSPASYSFGSIDVNIDYPQRMGDEPLFNFDFGQTDIRFTAGGFTFGFSTEEIWLGPGKKNALIISNNSGGFPHFDIGFTRLDTIIGSFEGRYLWGILKESDFFTSTSDDDWRLFSNISLAYSPFFIPGLTIGVNWSAMTPGGNFEVADFFVIPLTILGVQESNFTNDNDQKASVSVEWTFPEVGFQFYGELAWEDFNSSPLQIPEHCMFYTFGGSQAIQINNERGFLLNIEFSNLGVSDSQRLIWSSQTVANYYTHGRVIHGHTNNGQILGAAIGPGSDSQFFSLKYYDFWGSAELFFLRHNKNKTYIYNDVVTYDHHNLNVDLNFGLKSLIFIGPIDLFCEFVLTYELSHNYIAYNDIFNFYGKLGVRYRH